MSGFKSLLQPAEPRPRPSARAAGPPRRHVGGGGGVVTGGRGRASHTRRESHGVSHTGHVLRSQGKNSITQVVTDSLRGITRRMTRSHVRPTRRPTRPDALRRDGGGRRPWAGGDRSAGPQQIRCMGAPHSVTRGGWERSRNFSPRAPAGRRTRSFPPRWSCRNESSRAE